MVKVSIVVPVYNVEEYILECLTSIKNQTFPKFEAIIINDGSTDNSGIIAEEFCARDSRFIFINQENKGLGNTRNIGIERAKGKFITFIDSDDYISLNMIELLYDKARNEHSDVVCGETKLIYPDGQEKIRFQITDPRTFSIQKNGEEHFFRDFYFSGKYSHNAWDKLYKTDLIKRHNIKFGDNKLIFGEDNFFQLQFLLFANKISFVDDVIYYYRQRNESIMNSYKKDLMTRQIRMVKDYEKLTQSKTSKQISSLLTFEAITMEMLNIKQSNLSYKDFRNQMSKVRNDFYFRDKILDITKLKSYKLIPNMNKRNYVKIISKLEQLHKTRLSTFIIYLIYSMK